MAAPFNPQIDPTSLSRSQQDLLLAALATNVHPEPNLKPPSRASFDFSAAQTSPMFSSAPFNPALDDVDFASMDDQQFMEFMGRNGGADFDAIAPEDTLHEQDSPASPVLNDGELHDKRKNTEDDDDEENTPKRRESEEKLSKKPGRKPLTSEPTSVSRQPLPTIRTNLHQKRKAQNRAAQRAFRERKEKHLQDLKLKVEELEKTSESTNHENGLLKAQVEKLQAELREYRKRVSMQSAVSRGAMSNSYPSNSSSLSSLQYPIPMFATGAYNTPLFGNGINTSVSPSESSTMDFSASTGIASRHGSTTATTPGQTPLMSDALHSQRTSLSVDPLFPGGLTQDLLGTMGGSMPSTTAESPSNFNLFGTTVTAEPSSSLPVGQETQPASREFRFSTNPTGNSSSSPSTSSLSYGNGANSSCGTSPEPSGQSAAGHKDGSLGSIQEADPATTVAAVSQTGRFLAARATRS
jgi:AP-1-like factor